MRSALARLSRRAAQVAAASGAGVQFGTVVAAPVVSSASSSPVRGIVTSSAAAAGGSGGHHDHGHSHGHSHGHGHGHAGRHGIRLSKAAAELAEPGFLTRGTMNEQLLQVRDVKRCGRCLRGRLSWIATCVRAAPPCPHHVAGVVAGCARLTAASPSLWLAWLWNGLAAQPCPRDAVDCTPLRVTRCRTRMASQS
jgi:hypothetical protein